MAIKLHLWLDEIQSSLLCMIEKTRTMVDSSFQALLECDSSVAGDLLVMEEEVNALQVEIDEQCTRLLALQHPVAHDLRLIIAVMKITSDLERIADQSISLVKHARRLCEFPDVKPLTDIPKMAEMVQAMVVDTLKALAANDAVQAREILIRDDEVDAFKEQIIQNLIKYMVVYPNAVKACLQLVLAARNLERIADHATNIAEDIVYIVECKDVRHHAEFYPRAI